MLELNSADQSVGRDYNSQVKEEDLLVSREYLSKVSEPPLRKTTFFKLLGKGVIVAYSPIKGLYYLNKSRKRMNLPSLDVERVRAQMQHAENTKSERQLLFAALAILVEEAVTIFAEEVLPETMTVQEAEYVTDLVILHGRNLDGSCLPVPDRFRRNFEFPEITKVEDPLLRIAYVRGVLDAATACQRVSLTTSINE